MATGVQAKDVTLEDAKDMVGCDGPTIPAANAAAAIVGLRPDLVGRSSPNDVTPEDLGKLHLPQALWSRAMEYLADHNGATAQFVLNQAAKQAGLTHLLSQ